MQAKYAIAFNQIQGASSGLDLTIISMQGRYRSFIILSLLSIVDGLALVWCREDRSRWFEAATLLLPCLLGWQVLLLPCLSGHWYILVT